MNVEAGAETPDTGDSNDGAGEGPATPDTLEAALEALEAERAAKADLEKDRDKALRKRKERTSELEETRARLLELEGLEKQRREAEASGDATKELELAQARISELEGTLELERGERTKLLLESRKRTFASAALGGCPSDSMERAEYLLEGIISREGYDLTNDEADPKALGEAARKKLLELDSRLFGSSGGTPARAPRPARRGATDYATLTRAEFKNLPPDEQAKVPRDVFRKLYGY